jgi:hypothetical protein
MSSGFLSDEEVSPVSKAGSIGSCSELSIFHDVVIDGVIRGRVRILVRVPSYARWNVSGACDATEGGQIAWITLSASLIVP